MPKFLTAYIAKKRFGQNFLKDDTWIKRIAEAIDAKPGQRIIEIGPGQAALTRYLVRDAGQVEAIELDRDLVKWLPSQFKANQLKLQQADALKVNWKALLEKSLSLKARLCGNLPYNISSPLIFTLAKYAGLIQDQTFLLQKEMAQRLVAKPGTRAYGRPSVIIQRLYKMEILFDIPPTAFYPEPKVTSSLLRMTPRVQPSEVDEEVFERVVAQAFNKKRKTLKNNFKDILSPEILEWNGIPPNSRPEQISVACYIRLSSAVSKMQCGTSRQKL